MNGVHFRIVGSARMLEFALRELVAVAAKSFAAKYSKVSQRTQRALW